MSRLGSPSAVRRAQKFLMTCRQNLAAETVRAAIFAANLIYLSDFERRAIGRLTPRRMDRECRRFRLTCHRDTRYRLSKSTSISDASGGNRDIDFECGIASLSKIVNERFWIALLASYQPTNDRFFSSPRDIYIIFHNRHFI